MPEIYRAFIYVLIASLPALYLAKVALGPVVGRAEIKLWIGSWIFATCAVFLSGDILVFSALIGALSVYVHKNSDRPYLFFAVLLLIAPAVGVNLGIPGLIGLLLELNPARLLALTFLLPTAIRLFCTPGPWKLSTADKLFGFFAVLLIVLSARYGSVTMLMRAVAMILVDVVLPYYVFSRSIRSTSELRTGLAAFAFAALPFAAAGAFEFVRGWRVYNSVINDWEIVLIQPYLFRDGLLRAAGTAIEPIAFGFVCMVAIGLLLAIKGSIRSRSHFFGLLGLVAAGLAASLSRGPWLGAAVMVLIFVTVNRQGFANLVKVALAAGLVCAPLMFTPVGDRIYRLLPFVGNVEKSNEEYRTRLIEVSTTIVARNPFFGDVEYRKAPELEVLVQGQGIVDIVNTYVALALEYGLVGLAAFLGIFASLYVGLLRASLKSERDHADLLRALSAVLVAIGLTIGTVSSVSVIPYLYWLMAGLCTAALGIKHSVETVAQAPPRDGLIVLGRPAPFGTA